MPTLGPTELVIIGFIIVMHRLAAVAILLLLKRIIIGSTRISKRKHH